MILSKVPLNRFQGVGLGTVPAHTGGPGEQYLCDLNALSGTPLHPLTLLEAVQKSHIDSSLTRKLVELDLVFNA